MTITCEVQAEDLKLGFGSYKAQFDDEQRNIKVIALSFAGGATLYLSNLFFNYTEDSRFWYIGPPASLLVTLATYYYLKSDLQKKEFWNSKVEPLIKGHTGNNTFTIDKSGLREVNESGEYFTNWRFITAIESQVTCTLVRTNAVCYVIPARCIDGQYEAFIDAMIGLWNENRIPS